MRLRLLAGLALALSLQTPLAEPAAAQSLPQPAHPVFGIQPAPSDGPTSAADQLTYALASGTGVEDAVRLYNYTTAPLTLSLYAADVRAAAGGAIAPAQASEAMHAVGAWLRVPSPTVVVPPNGELLQRFQLQVPEGTVPGDYLGAIVAALDAPPVASGLSVQTRAARLVRLRVAGDVRLDAAIGKLRTSRHAHRQEFRVTVRNTGNVLFTLTGSVVIRGGNPEAVPLSPRGVYVPPGAKMTLTAHWDAAPRLGRRTAYAQLSVAAGEQPPRAFRSPALQLTYVPAAPTAAAGGLLVITAALLGATRERRRSWRRRRRDERALVASVRAQFRASTAPAAKRPHAVNGDAGRRMA